MKIFSITFAINFLAKNLVSFLTALTYRDGSPLLGIIRPRVIILNISSRTEISSNATETHEYDQASFLAPLAAIL